MDTPVAQHANIAMLDRLNTGYIDAVQASDVGWFEDNLAQDFLNTNPDGTLLDRGGFIAFIAKPAPISGLRASDVRIRRFGDVAIIHGKTTYTRADGHAGAGRYTDVYQRINGRWQVIAAHVTRG